jgi:hypothetical protein
MNRLFLVLFFKDHLIFPNLEKINESHKIGIVHFSTQRFFFLRKKVNEQVSGMLSNFYRTKEHNSIIIKVPLPIRSIICYPTGK